MNFPCCNPCITCPPSNGAIIPDPNDPANPFLNISSAAPDRDIFFGNYFPPPGGPPLGTLFTTVGCIGLCTSTVSQQDADDCAQRQQVICLSNGWHSTGPNPTSGTPPPPGFPPQPPTTNSPLPVFANTQQTCVFTCSDGTPFTYTIAAGTFFGFNQAAADALANLAACNRATGSRLCMGTFPVGFCLGSTVSADCSLSAQLPISSVALVAGTLPTGLSLSMVGNVARLSGVPTTIGNYTFSVRATDTGGNFMQKQFTVSIERISTASLVSGTEGIVYNDSLLSENTLPPVTWAITAGSLPPGLTLDADTGSISGTPTLSGTYHFVITYNDLR